MGMDTHPARNNPSERPAIYSNGVDHPSMFLILASTEARGNFMGTRTHGIFPHTTPKPIVANRICRLHAASSMESIPHGTPTGKSQKLPEYAINLELSPPGSYRPPTICEATHPGIAPGRPPYPRTNPLTQGLYNLGTHKPTCTTELNILST